MNALTPTQQAIYDILSDGKLHRREELHACLPDELGAPSNVRPHICNLRKRLNGQEIVCVYRGKTIYYWLWPRRNAR